MIDTALRHVKDEILEPIVKYMGSRLNPHYFTLTGVAMTVIAALCGYAGNFLVGWVFWLLNRLMDGLDGAYARRWNKQTDLGGYLDTLADFFAYTAIPIGLALYSPTIPLLLALVFLLGTFYINSAAFMYLSAILERRNLGAKHNRELTTITMPRGVVEGTEAIIFYSAFFLFPQYLLELFVILGVLVLATTFQHIVWAVRNLN